MLFYYHANSTLKINKDFYKKILSLIFHVSLWIFDLKKRIILVRGQNFATGGRNFVIRGQIFASMGPKFKILKK